MAETKQQHVEQERSNNSEFKMFGALKALDSHASERIAEKYKDILPLGGTPVDFDSSSSSKMDGTKDDVVRENRIAHLRTELTDAIIASVHLTQRVPSSGR